MRASKPVTSFAHPKLSSKSASKLPQKHLQTPQIQTATVDNEKENASEKLNPLLNSGNRQAYSSYQNALWQ